MLKSAAKTMFLNTIFLMTSTISLAASGHYDDIESVEDDLAEVAPPPFPIVHRILKTACGRCHQDGHHRGGIQLNTPMQVNRDAGIILQSIESGSMPYMDPTWNKTAEAKTVIRYLKAVIAADSQSENTEF